ncbi:hypothetical protein EMPS_02676 [Entomortierella parvispora]|uniref:T-box domain-containing protein n=1 Tax=Entomortierella parvispora TaxID=205924 RepID=A0A9P3LTV8_9FUNG|nr:hypothetical protein EMPS_02676 [Entomortierella parvispora]
MSGEEKSLGQSNKRPGSEPSLLLVNGDLWDMFHREDNEMIITKSGRCLFPLLQFKAVDLEPDTIYSIDIDFELMDQRRYRFVDGAWKCAQPWKKSANYDDEDRSEDEDRDGSTTSSLARRQETYTHPDLCQPGTHWMQTTISFSKIKLTNKIPEAATQTRKRSKNPPATSSHIFHLTSFHRYRPRVHLVQRSDQRRAIIASTTFTFDRTAFMAVTHYQNFRVNDLKKGYNPHAKGFRDSIQRSPSDSREASSSFDSSKLRPRSKRSGSYHGGDSCSEGEEIVIKGNNEGAEESEDHGRSYNPLFFDGSDSRVVTRSRTKQFMNGDNTMAPVRELDNMAIKIEMREDSPSATLRTPENRSSTHEIQTTLDSALYKRPLRQSHRSRPLSQKSKAPSTLREQPITKSDMFELSAGSKSIQTYPGQGAVAYDTPTFRQAGSASEDQKTNILQLTAPMTPMPVSIPSSALQLSFTSTGKPVFGYDPGTSDAATQLPIGTMTLPSPTSWYQQFFSWDQPSSGSSDALSQGPYFMGSSSPIPLQFPSGQIDQAPSEEDLSSKSNPESDVQPVRESLDTSACLISESMACPDEGTTPYIPDIQDFAYEGDRVAFSCTQTDTCHIWPSFLESKTMLSTSSVLSILPYYSGPDQANMDMVFQENLRLKAFIRERYGPEAEAEANAVMVMGRHYF